LVRSIYLSLLFIHHTPHSPTTTTSSTLPSQTLEETWRRTQRRQHKIMDLLASLGLGSDLPEQSTRLTSHPGIIKALDGGDDDDVRLGFNRCLHCGIRLPSDAAAAALCGGAPSSSSSTTKKKLVGGKMGASRRAGDAGASRTAPPAA